MSSVDELYERIFRYVLEDMMQLSSLAFYKTNNTSSFDHRQFNFILREDKKEKSR